jgi:hypothetical protein
MFTSGIRGLISIKVGRGDTAAKYRVASPAAFRATLMRLLDQAAALAG